MTLKMDFQMQTPQFQQDVRSRSKAVPKTEQMEKLPKGLPPMEKKYSKNLQNPS